MAAGRPTDYNEETAAEICNRMSEGESLRSICRSNDMPGLSTVFRWLGSHEEFREQYKIAMAARADAMFEEMFDIADDGTNDWMEMQDKDGESIGWKLNGEHVQRSRLRLDTRKWALSKMMPKKYGDKLADAEIDTNDGEITINVRRVGKDAN